MPTFSVTVEVCERLRNRELDIGWVLGTDLPPDLEFLPLEIQEAMLIMPPDNPLQDKARITFEDLRDEPFAMVALKVVGKKLEDVKIVTSGAGAAGIAIIRLMMSMGLKNVVMTDRKGAIYEGREGLNPIKEEMAKITNRNMEKGTLAEVIRGADVFVGVSAPGTLTAEMVKTMARDPIIFACANPTPEIFPDEAKAAGAAVISTGRSDYPNQVNNVLCFPGIFRGALDVRASAITEGMKIAAAYAIAGLVNEEELCAEYILPKAFDPRVREAVAAAVAEAARRDGVARI